ncbi:uncharacterized protein [Dasypus novemcinctus]|uniref:uncharacterized protein isoform X2 n=1 Tax=Dasypus novemcinctus TaxID=9361 RepID=UPI0026603356|nr:uncharacterized protein LOC131276914 isoform X2 [Dasypus novemcinctus]
MLVYFPDDRYKAISDFVLREILDPRRIATFSGSQREMNLDLQWRKEEALGTKPWTCGRRELNRLSHICFPASSWAYHECCHRASSDFFGLHHFLQEPLDRTRIVVVQVVLEKEKEEEVFPRKCRWKCGLNPEKTVDLPDIDGDFPGPPPFLSTGDQPEQLYEETSKAGETIVSRPKSGDFPWASDFADSQFIDELFNIRNISPGECPTILNLMGEQDVGKSPLKVYHDSEPKLQLEGEPQSQSPPGCAAEGFPNSPSLSSEDYEPWFPNVCRGNMTNSHVPYIHLEDRGSNLGLQEIRDSKVKTSWMVKDASLNLNIGKEDPEDFTLEEYPERESGSGPSLGIEMMDDPSQDGGSTESVMPQFLPRKGQGPQESKHRKRVSRMLQWICLGRKRNSHQAALKSTRSVLVSQQLRPSRTSTIPPMELMTPIRAHQHVPRVQGPRDRRHHFPLLCFMSCVSPTES